MKFIFTSILLLALLTSCETIIHPELEQADPVLVVDAWLTSQSREQSIKLMQTQPYFDNSLPPAVSSAIVSVKNETDSRVFIFSEEASTGNYTWVPSSPTDSLGKTGDEFTLTISKGSDTFMASSVMGRVPALDSITFTFQEASGFFPDYYYAEFWATDPAGPGDAYWIKAWRNDTLLMKPSEINIAYDAGFTESGNIDGVTFIAPIRQGISPFEADDEGQLISPFKVGDSVYVEIHTISQAAFNFLFEVQIQTDRPGGFAELFAGPLANVHTNVTNVNPSGKKAVGFFNVGMVSGNGKRLIE